MTAYPTILYATWKHTGDSALVTKHWPHLQRWPTPANQEVIQIPQFAPDLGSSYDRLIVRRRYLAWYERKLAPFPGPKFPLFL